MVYLALANAAKAAGLRYVPARRLRSRRRRAEGSARRWRRDRVASSSVERRSALDISQPRRSDRSRSELPVEDAQLSRAGRGAKINLALEGLPQFSGVNGSDPKTKLAGRIHIGPRSTISSALSTLRSMASFPPNRISISRAVDQRSSLAPAGKHVMSIHVQFAPYKLKKAIGPPPG